MYRLDTFAGVALPNLNSEADHSPAPARESTIAVPDGAFDRYGNGIAPPVLPYTMTYRATLFEANATAQRSKLDQWRALVRQRGALYRIARDDDNSRHWTTARLVRLGVVREYSHRNLQELEFVFQLLGAWNGETKNVSTSFPGSTDPVWLTTVLAEQPGSTFQVTNGGNIDQHEMTITLSASGASITSFQLTNTTTGQSINWSGTIADGSSLVIDTAALSVLVAGINSYDNFTWSGEHWMTLRPGTNDFSSSVSVGSGGTATLKVEWYDAYA